MKSWLKKAMGMMAAAGLVALSVSSVGAASAASAAAPIPTIKIGVALSYNNTAFWSAYVAYEQQFAKQYQRPTHRPIGLLRYLWQQRHPAEPADQGPRQRGRPSDHREPRGRLR